MGQRAHFAATLCQEAIVFRAAFSDSWLDPFRAMRNQIGGDEPEHFVNKSGNRSGFVFNSGRGIGKLTQGVQRAFERETAQVHVVRERRLLHEAAYEIVGDEVHPEFAFDHMGRLATQNIHVEVDFDLAEMKFDFPPSEVEFRKIAGRNGRIEQSGDERNTLGAKSRRGDGVTDDANRKAFGEKGKFLQSQGRWARGGPPPGDNDIKIWLLGKLGADGDPDLFFRQTHDGVHVACRQAGNGGKGTEPPVGENHIARLQDVPELSEKFRLMGQAVCMSTPKECSGVQAGDCDEVHDGKTTTGLLAPALRPASLIGVRVRHGEAGAVNDTNMPPVPKFGEGDVGLEPLGEVFLNFIEGLKGQLGAGLAIRCGGRTHGLLLGSGSLATNKGQEFSDSFAAGSSRCMHLIKEAPKGGIEGKEASAAVLAGRRWTQESRRNKGSKEFAKLGERGALRKAGKSFSKTGDWRLAKKQRSESLKKGSGLAHKQKYIYLLLDGKDKLRKTHEKIRPDCGGSSSTPSALRCLGHEARRL